MVDSSDSGYTYRWSGQTHCSSGERAVIGVFYKEYQFWSAELDSAWQAYGKHRGEVVNHQMNQDK